eukprot:TRINITY_DN32171_c0_g1_i1.p1 TRINITY_DN32171_c0_g1~~TRINITY_DN32171_c0_g1_i1.p1  ORF type:complete len:286 (+),score=13.63 TRINITY_DN32171_c0_g1_i1:79-936(+)
MWSVPLWGQSAVTPCLKGTAFGCGLAAIRTLVPDHAMIIATLAFGCDRAAAFRLGCAWGLAHCAGNGVICAAFLAAEANGFIHLKAVMAYADYVTGACLIFCGVYFHAFEEYYTQDPEVLARRCSACSASSDIEATANSDRRQLAGSMGVSAPLRGLHGQAGSARDAFSSGRLLGGALFGFLQGTVDPLSFVGLGILGHMEVEVCTIVSFFAMFFICSALLAGLLAVLCAHSSANVAGALDSKVLYRVSCLLAVVVGTGWLLAELHCENWDCPDSGGMLDSIRKK